jgi:spore germination cell wall hydrolase CwlJ-like protein
MRKYRIWIPVLLLFLSISLLTKTAFSDSILLDVSYNQLTDDTQKQIDCLADNIYHEAGYESRKGKEAVALVTLNRTQDSRFPSTICGVVKQKTSVAQRVVCQFSWMCQHNNTPKKSDAYIKAREVAVYVYANYENLKDITKGALYYHADYVNPRWKLEKTTVIGRHIFYKESGKRNDDKNESATEGRTIKTFFSSSDGRDNSY